MQKLKDISLPYYIGYFAIRKVFHVENFLKPNYNK